MEPARQNSPSSATIVKAAKPKTNSAQGWLPASLTASSAAIVAAVATPGQIRRRLAALPLKRPQASSGPIPVNRTSSTPIGVT